MEKKTNSKQPRRKYDDAFKTEALRMVSSGRSVVDLARSLGIGENLMYKWRGEQKSVYSPEETGRDAEIESLRKSLRQVETERDILKKALAIFNRKRRHSGIDYQIPDQFEQKWDQQTAVKPKK